MTPPCRHFGRCGGCVLQHWRDGDYRAWKAGLLSYALRQAGFAVPEPLAFHPGLPGERRRIDFAVRRAGGRIILGLHARARHRGDRPDRLPGAAPGADGADGPAAAAVARPAGGEARGVGGDQPAGLRPRLLLRTDAPLSLDDRNALTAFAAAHGAAACLLAPRPATRRRPSALLRPATTTLSGVAVRPPPGAFLQATAEGEAAIVEAVLGGLPGRITGKTRVAELYAGCGTLTFALARAVRVAAFEGDRRRGRRAEAGRQPGRPGRPGRGVAARPGPPAAVGQGTRRRSPRWCWTRRMPARRRRSRRSRRPACRP